LKNPWKNKKYESIEVIGRAEALQRPPREQNRNFVRQKRSDRSRFVALRRACGGASTALGKRRMPSGLAGAKREQSANRTLG
jgi:hypothetical protein